MKQQIVAVASLVGYSENNCPSTKYIIRERHTRAGRPSVTSLVFLAVALNNCFIYLLRISEARGTC